MHDSSHDDDENRSDVYFSHHHILKRLLHQQFWASSQKNRKNLVQGDLKMITKSSLLTFVDKIVLL